MYKLLIWFLIVVIIYQQYIYIVYTVLSIFLEFTISTLHEPDRLQFWVGSVSRGPNNQSLLGSYQNSETLTYQDEVGAIVSQICEVDVWAIDIFIVIFTRMVLYRLHYETFDDLRYIWLKSV